MTAAIARDVPPQDGEAFYRDRWAQGEDTGESFRWLQSIHAGDGGARGRIARPAGCLGRRSPHPGVIEALFQLVYCCRAIETRESVAATGTVLVPARIERVAWRGEPRGGMTGYAAIREAQADTSSVIADLALVDDDGRTILSVSGFELRPLAREALTRAVRPAVVATRWQPAPPPAATRAGPLCLLGQGPFVDALYARLCEARPVQRHAAASAADIPDGAAVAWLWPLAVSFDPDRDPARPAVDRLLGGLFDLLQASGRRRLPGTRITVVTRHAHALPERNERCDPMQSAAWGFVRVAAREYPNCTFRLVDIDDGEESTMAALARELLGEDDEGEIALRRGARYASRAESVELAASCDGVPPAARYVVTENGGGQGDIVACHLARRGIAVAVCPADGVEAALAGDETTGLVATGSAPCDGLIDGARWDDYASRLSASVDTLLAIHRASTRVADLVLFAAGAARTGNPGQGAYAAAGAFAIGLAARRRTMGLPGRSLAWGPWANTGQWPRLDPRRRARLLADGIAPIGTDDALAALDAFLDGPALDLHVSGVDAGSMAPAKPHAQSDTACAGQHAPARSGPADDVEHRLRELLADQLGIAPDRLDPDTPLRDLGIDSLDAVSLGEAIETGFGVPAAIGNVVDAGSVRALARLVASRMAPAAPPPVAAGDRTVLVRLTAGRGRPVFCMPADSGTALSLKPLADAMELDRPVYACQAPGTDDGDTTPDSIAGLAQRYVAAMRGVQRTGPYTIIGRCSGGLAAYHAAALLREQGDVVEHLVLIDTLPPAAASSDPALAARQARIDAAIRARIDALPPTARARFARAQAALDHAVNSYRPSLPFDGRLVLVRGEDDRHPVQDDWRALAGGGVEFIDVPGDHQTMFERDALAALAAALAGAVGTGP